MRNLPDEIEKYIFEFLSWRCHVCKCNINNNNINKIITKCNSKFVFCSDECYNFI